MYKCIKGFLIDIVDGDGFTVEQDGFEVDEGTIWEIDEESNKLIGGEIRLVNDSFDWIEICRETLEEHFIEIS